MPDYQLYLCLMLVTRLVYLRQDAAASWRFSLTLALSQAALLLLVFGIGGATFAVMFAVSCFTLVGGLLESRVSVYAARFAVLVLLAVAPLVLQPFFGALSMSSLSLALSTLLDHGLQALLGGGVGVPRPVLPVLLGFLLLANEVNVIMRGVFQALRLEPRVNPPAADGKPDIQEYNAGRVIGILERWLMFLVVLFTSDWAALGFIVAAKSLVRFDQFKDRRFAEYMLVGTFMSALFAIAVASMTGMALPGP